LQTQDAGNELEIQKEKLVLVICNLVLYLVIVTEEAELWEEVWDCPVKPEKPDSVRQPENLSAFEGENDRARERQSDRAIARKNERAKER